MSLALLAHAVQHLVRVCREIPRAQANARNGRVGPWHGRREVRQEHVVALSKQTLHDTYLRFAPPGPSQLSGIKEVGPQAKLARAMHAVKAALQKAPQRSQAVKHLKLLFQELSACPHFCIESDPRGLKHYLSLRPVDPDMLANLANAAERLLNTLAPQDVAERLKKRNRQPKYPERNSEIARLCAKGWSSGMISKAINREFPNLPPMSPGAVRAYLSRQRARMNACGFSRTH
jgi:hypothetical protein